MIAAFALLALLTQDLPVAEPSTVARRLEEVTAAFVGAPYRRSPLGEGTGIDPDPRYREDAFDCLTLVETAIARLHRTRAEEARRVLDDIRYASSGEIRFETRLHLMEAQWIPETIRKGYVEEVTPLHGGEEVIELEIPLDAERWRRRNVLPQLRWDPAWEGVYRLPVIPIEAAIRLAESLPAGLVLNVVREGRAGDVTRISHTGLVVERDGKRYVRHAALRERRVIDEPLSAFLVRHARMRKRPVTGIHLLAVRDNAERVSALFERGESAVAGR